MDTTVESLRPMVKELVREAVEKERSPCHFLISYDVSKLNEVLRRKLHEKIEEHGGRKKNESLYCFDGGEWVKSRVTQEITELLNGEADVATDTLIYCVTAEKSRLVFNRITTAR